MFELKSPAKINWSLYVLNKRDDGYHNIISLMQCIGLYDTLAFEEAPDIQLISNMDIQPERNLVYKAACLLQERSGIRKGALIDLKKKIPHGAGLGGGSSNAASTLIGLNHLWELGMDIEDLKNIGAELGSDVPVFFHCPAAIAEGRGEVLNPVATQKSYHILLVKPDISVSTASAYTMLGRKKDSMNLTKNEEKINNIKLIYNALNADDMRLLKTCLHNDFEESVFNLYPIIGELKERLIAEGAAAAVMSGSGSTVLGIFESRQAAVKASEAFAGYWSAVVETLTG
jgi:4-diphosphocytidyl-2-C-methyl-D-erythritol kinase